MARNKEEQKKSPKAKIVDIIYLIITAIIVQGLLIALFYFLIVGLKIPDEWMFFMGACFIHNAAIIGFAISARFVKKYRPIGISVFILILMTNIPWIVLVLLVSSGKLDLPHHLFPYWVGTMILVTPTLFYYRLILKKLRKRQKGKNPDNCS
jgi:hypothetical protein